MTKRYTVSRVPNRFLRGEKEPAVEFFDQIHALPRTSKLACKGNIEADGGRVPVAAEMLLGDDDDFVVIPRLEEHDRLSLLQMFPMLAIDEDVTAHMALFRPPLLDDSMAAGGVKAALTVLVTDPNGTALKGVTVRLVFGRTPVGIIGAEAQTDSKGVATILFNAARTEADYLIAEPTHSYWPQSDLSPNVHDGKQFTLVCEPLSANSTDVVDLLYAQVAKNGTGVKVAIIDGGVGPHTDVAVATSSNLVPTEAADIEDNGVGHGTHVAGIVRRLAPNATLSSYRVFPKNSTTTNGSIVAAAVRQAVLDGMQLINLSITFEKDQPVLQQVLQFAQAHGVVCVCAAGNDAGPVLTPARYAQAVAVSACARTRTWPGKGLDPLLRPPAGTKLADIYAATFTCFGSEISVCAPGVGIVSLFPVDRRAAMTGTSMAAPVVTGLLATALSNDPAFLAAKPDVARAASIVRFITKASTLAGLEVGFEGHGIPLLT